jgi:hypothetical protein
LCARCNFSSSSGPRRICDTLREQSQKKIVSGAKSTKKAGLCPVFIGVVRDLVCYSTETSVRGIERPLNFLKRRFWNLTTPSFEA